MTQDKQKIPKELEELETIAYRAMVQNPATYPKKAFITQLQIATKSYRPFKDSATNESLARSWLMYSKYIGFESQIPDAYVSDIDSFISLLLKKKLVQYAITEPDNAIIMQCLLMTRVRMAEIGYSHPKKHNVADVINQWSGHQIKETAMKSLEAFVNTLYGKGAWIMFRSEVEDENMLPRLLATQNLPMLQPKTKAASQHALPDDFGHL